jgi:hypothetical protein
MVKRAEHAVLDWNTLRGVARQGYQDGLECLASIDLLQRMNAAEVIARINKGRLAQTLDLIVKGTLFRLHVYVVRAFAKVQYEDDRHLASAIDFLRQPGRLDDIPWPIHRERLESAIRRFDLAIVDSRYQRLKLMRDKQLAHFAEYDRTGGPTYTDLYEFAGVAAAIWEDLAFGSQVIMIEMELQMKAYRKSNDSFWSGPRSQTENRGCELTGDLEN